MSTYTSGIPLSTDLVSSSQSQLLGNFNAIVNTTYGLARNHIAITDGTNGGLHTRVDYAAAVSSPNISGFVSSAYPKTVTNIELFYKNAQKDMQISNSLLTASSGQGMMAGGLQIRCGNGAITNGNQTATVSYLTFPTAGISAQVTGFSTGTTLQVPTNMATNGQTGFTVQRSGTSGNAAFYWIAVGY